MDINTNKKEPCQTVANLFEELNEKSRTQHNQTILVLQSCKISRHADETAKVWIGRLRAKPWDLDTNVIAED